MKRILLIKLCIVLGIMFTTHSSLMAQSSLEGNWVGGTNVLGRATFIQARFSNTVPSSLDVPSANAMRMPILKLNNNQSAVQFEVDSPYGMFNFNGKIKDDVIEGSLSSPTGMKGEMHLVKVAKIDPKKFDDYVGAYKNANNQTIFITYNPFDALSVVFNEGAGVSEAATRTTLLMPSSESSFFTSRSANAPPKDKDETVTFVRNDKGIVTGLEWVQPDGKQMSAQKLENSFQQEAVSFQNDKIKLGATLFLPATGGKHPAIVIVPGGGPSVRGNAALFLRARQFCLMGYAVLVYDKRGTGDASGAPWSATTYDEASQDALAAIEFLKKRSDIDAQKIGLQGNSEAGWVVPLAATVSEDVRFVIIGSGGGITNSATDVHEANVYIRQNKLSTEDANELLNFVKAKWNYALTGNGWDEYEAMMKKAQTKAWFINFGGATVKNPEAWRKMGLKKDKDIESEKIIEKIKVPVLLLFGEPELDTQVPVKDSMAAWERTLKMSGHKDYMIKQFTGVGHAIFLKDANGKTILVNEAFETVKKWLAAHVKLSD